MTRAAVVTVKRPAEVGVGDKVIWSLLSRGGVVEEVAALGDSYCLTMLDEEDEEHLLLVSDQSPVLVLRGMAQVPRRRNLKAPGLGVNQMAVLVQRARQVRDGDAILTKNQQTGELELAHVHGVSCDDTSHHRTYLIHTDGGVLSAHANDSLQVVLVWHPSLFHGATRS